MLFQGRVALKRRIRWRSVSLAFYLSFPLSFVEFLFVCVTRCVPRYLSVCLSLPLSLCLAMCVSFFLNASLPTHLGGPPYNLSMDLVRSLLEPVGFELVSEEPLSEEKSHPGRKTILCRWRRT